MPYFTQTRILATCDAGIVERADGGAVSIGGAAVPSGIAAAFATSSACGGAGEGPPPRTGSEFEGVTRGDFGVNSASAACRARAIRSRLSGYRLPGVARPNPGRRGG